MIIKNIANNQTLTNDNGVYSFFSYETKIATVTHNSIQLTDKWDYSKTTTKYLCRFLEIVTGDSYNTKKIRTDIAFGKIVLMDD